MFSWKNELDNDSGFIDIVIENKHRTSVMLIEYKRVLDSSWIFFVPKSKAKPRRHAKAWVTRFARDCFKHLCWADISLDPDSPESELCVIPGQSDAGEDCSGMFRSRIENIIDELGITLFNGLVMFDFNLMPCLCTQQRLKLFCERLKSKDTFFGHGTPHYAS